jgi:hypothetical protein
VAAARGYERHSGNHAGKHGFHPKSSRFAHKANMAESHRIVFGNHCFLKQNQ